MEFEEEGSAMKKKVALKGDSGEILGVKEGSPRHFFKFCIDGICNDANSPPEYPKPVFLTFRKFRFSLGSMAPSPHLILHQKAIRYPTRTQNFRAIILKNELKTTWLSPNGTHPMQ